MKNILEQLGTQMLPLVVTALGGLSCALVAMATAYIKSKTKNTKVQAALDRFDQVAETAVKEVQQSVVDAAKSSDDPSTVAVNAKKAAMDSIKSHYGQKGIDELKKILGWESLDVNASSKIEAKVHDLKLAKSASLTT